MSDGSFVSREPERVEGRPPYRIIALDRPAHWTPRYLWGFDFFVWHIPVLKTTLALDALIVWWLS